MEHSPAVVNVPLQGLAEKADVSMDNSENISNMPSTGGHTLLQENNDIKRAKYDDTVNVETPSTSRQDAIAEVTHMEVEEEPEIIEVSLLQGSPEILMRQLTQKT